MNTTTINDAETARKVADKIVTLMTSITEQESAQEREMNAVAARYATVIDTLKAELKELQAAFQKYLKKAANQKALFPPFSNTSISEWRSGTSGGLKNSNSTY